MGPSDPRFFPDPVRDGVGPGHAAFGFTVGASEHRTQQRWGDWSATPRKRRDDAALHEQHQHRGPQLNSTVQRWGDYPSVA
jgi:hypothetical protein